MEARPHSSTRCARTQGMGMRCRFSRELGPQTHFGSHRARRRSLSTFLRQHERGVVWVFAVCACARERARGKETTTALSR